MGGRGASSGSSGSVAKAPRPTSQGMAEQREANAAYFKSLGATVSNDGLVTLYHATDESTEKKINKEGFKGSTAPVNGGAIEQIKPRSFFGYDKKWIEDTWSSGGTKKVMTVKIPAEYLHMAGNNRQEIFVEGNIKKHGKVWIPDTAPTSTAWDRITVKRYKRRKNR